MADETLVAQTTMKPTRKVTSGAIQGGGAAVGLNLLASIVMNRAYGGIENVPGDELALIMWATSMVPVIWQSLASYFTKDRAVT